MAVLLFPCFSLTKQKICVVLLQKYNEYRLHSLQDIEASFISYSFALYLLRKYNEYRLHSLQDIEASFISYSFALYLLRKYNEYRLHSLQDIEARASYLTRLHYICQGNTKINMQE